MWQFNDNNVSLLLKIGASTVLLVQYPSNFQNRSKRNGELEQKESILSYLTTVQEPANADAEEEVSP